MLHIRYALVVALGLFRLALVALAAPAEASNTMIKELDPLLNRAVQTALDKFADKNLQTNQLAATLLDLRQPDKPVIASYRGGERIYPASVIKLFYLVAAHRWLEDGKLKDSEELRRSMRDMIVDSSNDATSLIVDALTDTTSGPELSPAEMEIWYQKRNAVNRYFTSLGFTNINVNRKPWNEGPYGREMQSIKLHAPNHRNWLTTDATARMLAEIVQHKAVTPARCDQMLELLKRDPFDKTESANSQGKNFTGMALPPGSKLWSKAGWTSETRHDAAYVELPGGGRFVLVIFTTGHANDKEIIPTVARVVVEGMGGE
jgi:beta-lactamase class A